MNNKKIDPKKTNEIMPLRIGQIEIYLIDPENVPENPEDYLRADTDRPPKQYFVYIKLFQQTDEEAGGIGINRRAMTQKLDGTYYVHNGEKLPYKKVATCKNPDREYAYQTILIRGPYDEIIQKWGDWDYEKLVG